MADVSIERGEILHRFQSNVVLRTARLVFLAAAAVCLLGIVVGLGVALYFHTLTLGSPAVVPVVVQQAQGPTSIDLNRVDARLVPPVNVRFIVSIGRITRPLGADEIIGTLEADTPNGVARYPEDFDILGGPDASMFRRMPRAPQQRSALVATPELRERIDALRSSASGPESRRFELTVVARDTYGRLSAPTDITIELPYGPTPTAIASAPPRAPAAAANPSDLQVLAGDIARLLDPTMQAGYDQEVQRALQVPQNCGADASSPAFVANFRQAFEHARPKLTPSSIGAFYAGVCDAWRQLVSQHQALRAEAEAARAALMRQNANAESEFGLRTAAGWAGRNVALSVVGAAFGTFLTLALLLALLAIENHSKALRETAAALMHAKSQPDPMAPS